MSTINPASGWEIETAEGDGFGQVWAVWIEDPEAAATAVATQAVTQVSMTSKRRLTPEELAKRGMRPGDVLKIGDIIP